MNEFADECLNLITPATAYIINYVKVKYDYFFFSLPMLSSCCFLVHFGSHIHTIKYTSQGKREIIMLSIEFVSEWFLNRTKKFLNRRGEQKSRSTCMLLEIIKLLFSHKIRSTTCTINIINHIFFIPYTCYPIYLLQFNIVYFLI